MNFRQDFPIFKNNPNLVFLDSTASSQKPSYVIDGIKEFLENSYSNIHRGMYDIAIRAEDFYVASKKIVAKHLEADDYREVIYTFNTTYASNLLTSTLKKNKILKKGDKVLLSIAEHHANIVPWLMLKEEIGIEVEFVKVTKDYDLDFSDFEEKYDNKVKIISFTQVSNVTGQIFDLERVGKLKRDDTLFVVDASQSIPHFPVSVKKLNCDFLFFTGHKVLADSGIGVLWGKKKLLEKYSPSFSGGGAIGEVTCASYTDGKIPDKFEPGTPNVTGAVSLLRAFEYIEKIGGFEKIDKVEKELIEYFLEKIKEIPKVKLIGSTNPKKRIGVFSLVFEGIHSNDFAEILAENQIAVRSGKHCAHPFHDFENEGNSLRVSLYLYNDKADIDKLIKVAKELKREI
ncbi:aminotransferase class V-fold PLP-dependent enzyme [Candidatus Gracilibacteria bacterium]|nr:MAG: aminotransferase class V-fold PLP-dependent enzyme [Candidatus Gracilibacteria bacterium]